jgi:hypothetical protein
MIIARLDATEATANAVIDPDSRRKASSGIVPIEIFVFESAIAGHSRHRIEEQFEWPTVADHSLGEGSVPVHVTVDESWHHGAI